MLPLKKEGLKAKKSKAQKFNYNNGPLLFIYHY